MALLNRLIDFGPIADLLWVKIKPEIDQWRADAMTVVSEALPEMAAEVAKQTVLTTFEHTQVDEAADAVSNRIIDIVNRLPRFPFLLGGKQ